MNKSSSSNRPRNPVALTVVLVPVIILVVLIAIWSRNQSNTQDQLNRLSAQNRQLQQELAAAKAEIDNFNSGDSSAATKERLAQARTSAPVVAEVETLFLRTPIVDQTSRGLVVRFRFDPKPNTDLPETIALVARVPSSSDSKIVAFTAIGGNEESRNAPVISPTRNLGMIEASTKELGDLTFEMTVTTPVKATIRGSEGIIDFEIDITPDKCTVRKL